MSAEVERAVEPPEPPARSEGDEQHLRRTIEALRDELERLKIAEQERFDRAMAAAAAETRQLRETVQALRDALERLRIAEQERLDRALAAAGDENRQLRGAVESLRDELDRRRVAEDERDARRARELAEARATIVALRQELEAALGAHQR